MVEFSQPLKEDFNLDKTINNVRIKLQDKLNGKIENVFIFSAELKNIEFEQNKETIKISNKTLDKLIDSIENLINIVSLSIHNGRVINSSNPSIFLEHENIEDYRILSQIDRFEFDKPKLAYFSPKHTFNIDFCLENLKDRFDGVRLITEAITASTFSDKFREYFRLFEIAFKKSNRALAKPMTDFLIQDKRFNYSKQEIEKWINIRHRIVHANHKEGFLINRNLLEIMARIEQAAIDILFNKLYWNNGNIERKNIFLFKTGVNENNQVFSLPNLTYDYSMIAFDETHTFPMSTTGGFKPELIPKTWKYDKRQN